MPEADNNTDPTTENSKHTSPFTNLELGVALKFPKIRKAVEIDSNYIPIKIHNIFFAQLQGVSQQINWKWYLTKL